MTTDELIRELVGSREDLEIIVIRVAGGEPVLVDGDDGIPDQKGGELRAPAPGESPLDVVEQMMAAGMADERIKIDDWKNAFRGHVTGRELDRAASYPTALPVQAKGHGADHRALVATVEDMHSYLTARARIVAGRHSGEPPEWAHDVLRGSVRVAA